MPDGFTLSTPPRELGATAFLFGLGALVVVVAYASMVRRRWPG